MNQAQRADLGETIRDLANLAVAALSLGQFVTQQTPSWPLLLTGIVFWFACVSFALVLRGGR